jgi:hypothetical protein
VATSPLCLVPASRGAQPWSEEENREGHLGFPGARSLAASHKELDGRRGKRPKVLDFIRPAFNTFLCAPGIGKLFAPKYAVF